LVNRSAQGLTPEDIESIFITRYAGLYRYAYTLLKEKEAARDAVQQVFVSIWEKRAEIRISVSLEAYLYRALFNYCMNCKVRDRKYLDLGDHLPEHSYPMADLVLECKELQVEINRAIASLPAQCKIIFLKSRMEGKSYSGIAQEQGIAVKTVEVQVSKALRIIRSKLEQYLALVILAGVLFTYKSSLWQLFLL